MKRFTLLFLLSIALFSSCKKGGGTDTVTPVDPREALVGTYEVGGNVIISLGPAILEPESFTGTITVAKGTATNQITLDVNLPDLKIKLNAELNQNEYQVTDTQLTEPIIVNRTSRTGQMTAKGKFLDGNQIQFLSTAEFAGTAVYRKDRNMVGPKK